MGVPCWTLGGSLNNFTLPPMVPQGAILCKPSWTSVLMLQDVRLSIPFRNYVESQQQQRQQVQQ